MSSHPLSPLPANPLLRLLAINAAGGAVAALLVVAGLYLLDVGGLQRLSAASTQPLLPVLMLAAAFIVTFASAAMGGAVMLLPGDWASGDRGHGRRAATLRPVPQRVPASRGRHR
ncbi:MAG: hypothetical protein AB7O39_04995 [Flavobacteriaceae bacterium]